MLILTPINLHPVYSCNGTRPSKNRIVIQLHTMSANSTLFWVNKTPESSSLSNCANEKNTLSQIRSHTLTVAHKSNRVNRLIKRTPHDLSWTPRNITRGPIGDLSFQASTQKYRDSSPLTDIKVSESKNIQRERDSPSDTSGEDIFRSALQINCLSGIPDPFLSYSIELDTTALDLLWYFENIWTQCAFKLPGCVGYGQKPVEQYEITAMIQQCLANKNHSYCLLAATSARIQYIHHHDEARYSHSGLSLAHGYAGRALHGVRQRIEVHSGIETTSELSEEESTDILFLAAYEIFCWDETGAEQHLTAVRRLYKQEISNIFIKRLQANLERLVAKSAAGAVGKPLCHAV